MKFRSLTILLIAAALLPLLSCGEERTGGDTDGKTQIGFSTALESRAAALTSPAELAAKGGFNVWAYSHTVPWSTPPSSKGTVFDGTTVRGNSGGTSWSYDNPVDWPFDRYVSFFACGPAGSATMTGNNPEGAPTVRFTVNPVAASQTDFLIAHPVYDQAAAYYSNGGSVNIRFEHALSRIVFSGVLLNEPEEATRKVSVRSIVLNGLYSAGTAALGTGPIEWTADGLPSASYTASIATGELGNVQLTAASSYITTVNGSLFLMPQPLAREPGATPTMTVTVDIDGITAAYPAVPLFSPASWKPGKTYNYQIIIDGNDLHVIGVEDDSMTLNPWNINVYVNPVVMITDHPEVNGRKIDAAMRALETISMNGYSDPNFIPETRCNYFAIYFSGIIDMDIIVDMGEYPGFQVGDVVMLDAKKLVTAWGRVGHDDTGSAEDGYTDNYTLEVLFDEDVWELMDAMQPQPEPYSPPSYPPGVDAVSGATTNSNDNENDPLAAIQNKGSVIVRKIAEQPQP